MNIAKNQEYTVTVTDQNNLGHGIARIDGMVVFIPNGMDGDTVRIRIIKVTKTYCVGKLIEILSPSAHRIASPCALSEKCGGCMYMALDYAHELTLKHRRVRAAFQKAGLPDVKIADVVPSPEISRYRNKVQIPLCDGQMGYYAPHSHRIVPMESCQLHLSVFDPILQSIGRFVSRFPSDSKKLRHVYLRGGEVNGQSEVMVALIHCAPLSHTEELVAALTHHPAVKSIYLNFNDTDGNVILGRDYTLLWGDETICDILCDMTFAISPASFYQVNRPSAELAYRKLLELAGDLSGQTVLDLYCGIGTIGLFIKKNSNCERLIGVEIIEQAVENARRNARRNGVDNAEFVCGDAFYQDGILLNSADTVIVDPPRKGCSRALIDALCESRPKQILYMSCEVETLARDAALLMAAGYRISTVTPIDLFPRTGHVECVALLERQAI